ncbi:UNVERIFIED_CONTAM: hypothetical protein BEN50_11825 [Euhalothece sp. KZN 001]
MKNNKEKQLASTGLTVAYRSYCRVINGKRESFIPDVLERTVLGLAELGKLNLEEIAKMYESFENLHFFPAGRWLWQGGTEHSKKQSCFYSSYNCFSLHINSIEKLVSLMNFAMQGGGTGAVLEWKNIDQLPSVKNTYRITVWDRFNTGKGEPETKCLLEKNQGTLYYEITVGDSREGWCDAYWHLLDVFTSEPESERCEVKEILINLSNVRPKGIRLDGFGGVSNPEALPNMFERLGEILNYRGSQSTEDAKKLTAEDVALLIDEAGKAIVAGNIRRKAGIHQFDSWHKLLKMNLWQQGDDGNWRIDPKRDALRFSNHTLVYHRKPTLIECQQSVKHQFESGEGAIQYTPEAIARANADLLSSKQKKKEFLQLMERNQGYAKRYLHNMNPLMDKREIEHRMSRYGLNPCFGRGTKILTTQGNYPIEQLIGKEATIWDGERWVTIDNFRVTGRHQPVYKVKTASCHTVYATSYHPFILEDGTRKELKDLKPFEDCLLVTSGFDWISGFYPEEFEGSNELKPNLVTEIIYLGKQPKVYCCTVPTNHQITLANGIITGQCGEIIGSNYACNLSEVNLNMIDPKDWESQKQALQSASLSVASMLHHEFPDEFMRYSREIDPIVAVCITGVFDFFVNLFGVDWLRWWSEGRSRKDKKADYYLETETDYLMSWRLCIQDQLYRYCEKHNLKTPNRFTSIQPSGSKSLLTGASPGWHPPKAPYMIRRIELAKNDPIALALSSFGYNIIPNQDSKDEYGNLLPESEIYSEQCEGWLVEFPIKTSWADLDGAENYPTNQFSCLAQLDFMMQCQKHYVTHNTSATPELREHEIDEVGEWLYKKIQNDEGYVSCAFLARFDDHETFPRLPFEPISKEEYYQLEEERKQRSFAKGSFYESLTQYDDELLEQSPNACEGMKCQF